MFGVSIRLKLPQKFTHFSHDLRALDWCCSMRLL